MNRRTVALTAITCAAISGRAAVGGFIDYHDKAAWLAAVGAVTTLDFVGLTPGSFITDEYANLGVLFADGNDSVLGPGGFDTFPNDGWGLDGNGNITLLFASPQAWIAVDFPGNLRIDLYREGLLIYNSGEFGVGGVGNFGGVVSSELFDRAILTDIQDQAAVDDIFFGVPGPGVVPLLGFAGLWPPRRRRVPRSA